MTTRTAFPWRRWFGLAVLLTAGAAPAQFTSTHSFVTLPGNFNGFDTLTPRMSLISNGVWQACQSLTNFSNPQFLFATENFGTTWKETNQPAGGLPLLGIAEQNNGSDILLATNFSGTLRIRFAEGSGAYSVFNATAVESGGGDPWINEIHYDDAGGDANEGFEIAGPAGLSLAGYSLVLYSGEITTGNMVYRTLVLSGTLTNQANDFGTIYFPVAPVENGPIDGVALVQGGSRVIQFLSYEGSFTAAGGPAEGMTSQDIGVSENNNPDGQSLQLTGTGGAYTEFTWVGPIAHTRGNPNTGQTFLGLPPPVSVTVSNLVNAPWIPLATNTVHVEADLSPVNGASNLSATAFYRTNGAAAFSPIPMAVVSGNHYRTVSPILGQPAGSYVSYYVFVNYDGPGTNSPTLHPSGSPSNAASYGVSAVTVGSVWINEISPECDTDANNTKEFVEIIGVAGTDITGWQLESYDDLTNLVARYTVTNLTRLADEASGFGFFVVGDTSIPGVDLVLPGDPADDHLPPNGALRLRDSVGVTMDAVRYGTFATNFSIFPSVYAGEDYADWLNDNTLVLTGTGGLSSAFTWTTNIVNGGTPNATNQGQVLSGGNTNKLLPVIVCRTNIINLGCVGSPIPAASVTNVIATSLCGTGLVVTILPDTTNTGTGCFGNPRIITRTYRAVSTTCNPATTNQAVQLIILEDRSPPILTFPTQQLVNAGFEQGDLGGWTPFGVVSNNIAATVALPRSGFFNARILAPVSTVMYDSGLDSIDGMYSNGPAWNQASVSAGMTPSVLFDGVNDKADVPWDDVLNHTNFSFSLWAKVSGGQGTYRSPLTSRDDGPPRGYMVYATDTTNWTFVTGTRTGTWQTLTGPAVTVGSWVHLAGTYDGGSRMKKFYVNGSLSAQDANATFTANAVRPLRIGGGATEQAAGQYFFPGNIDDVQIYDYALEAAQVTTLYNGGTGGTTATGKVAHYEMRENPNSLGRTSGLYQAMSSVSGQTWQASAYLLQPSSSPLRNSNEVRVALEFLNSTGTVLTATNSTPFGASSPTNRYVRYAVRGVSPTNTAFAQLRITYTQDGALSPGSLYIDDTVLTPFVITAGLSCATMPNYLGLVSATDECGGVTITQSPPSNTVVGSSNITVRFTATDQCGLASTGSIQVSVEDLVNPTVIAYTTNLSASCLAAMPPANPSGVVATDNCGSVVVTLESTTIPTNSGCLGNPKLVVYRYRITDGSGNFTNCDQTVTVLDTNAPTYTFTRPDLTNGSFEAGSVAGWNAFGAFQQVTNLQPRSGSHHVVIYGATNGQENYTGLWQELPATPGTAWRAAGFVLQSPELALQGSNRVELKIEFLNNALSIIHTQVAPYFTSNSYREVYVPISVTATAPTATAWARCTVLLFQPNTPSNAPGTVYLDDFTLSRHMVSVDPANCRGYLPTLTDLPEFDDCGSVTINQKPIPGSLLNLGWNTNVVVALDSCSQTARVPIDVYVVDDIPPVIIAPPTNIYIQVASTNAVPYPSSNEVVAADNCGLLQIIHVSDVKDGGSGQIGSPMTIIRTYRVQDTFSNAVLTRQTITVEGPLPTAPASVSIHELTMGSNLMVRSVGTNAWAVRAEFTTNLIQVPPSWNPIHPRLNYSLSGTNISFFDNPTTNNRPFIIRLWQYFP